MTVRIRSVVVALLAASAGPLAAQDAPPRPTAEPLLDDWRWTPFSTTDGLPSPDVYEITGGNQAVTLLSEDDFIRRRAGFTEHTLWVAPHEPDELFAAGDYPTAHTAGQGLPSWTKQDRPIVNTDLVVWYTVGFHHIPRPEDWPIMPVAWHSFELKPVGFFERNPALDLPKGR
jgi:primary-amine oxidase